LVASAIVLVVVISTSSQAGRRNTPVMRTGTVQQHTLQQQQPIKLRYYGGPKYPMYPG
jgi:hypothetical protein